MSAAVIAKQSGIHLNAFQRSPCEGDSSETGALLRGLQQRFVPTRMHGDFLPRHIAGRLHNMFALLRNIWLAIRVGLSPRERHDVLVCDQISVCVPILRLL